MKILSNKLRVLLIAITLILSVLLINQMQYRNDELYAVNLKNKIDNDLVSILVSDGSENYTKYEGSTFPSNTEYTYNSELSKCQDNNGNVIEGILSYDETTGKVSVKTMKTTYCYLYFDKKSTPFAEEIIASGELWQSGLEGDGYRYIGTGAATASTTPNNFICFGTTSLSECKANEEKYMYRIIGVFTDETGEQHLKLVKFKQLSEKYMWHNDYTVDVPWGNSDLYKGLNGISGGGYNNLFIGNEAYGYLQDSKWLDKITDWKWTAADTTSKDGAPDYQGLQTEQLYLHEMNRSTKKLTIGLWLYPVAKIGLMYVSDCQMSMGSGSLKLIGMDDYRELRTGWLSTLNNDTTVSDNEWSMSRMSSSYYGLNLYRAWLFSGNSTFDKVTGEYAVSPTFYLNNNVAVSDGTGSYSNPYLIQE